MLVFPQIRGLTWQGARTPQFETLTQRMSSGKEFRLSYWQNPLWKWELNYNYIKDNPNDLISGQTETDLAILQGFFLQMRGQYDVFLYDDYNAGDQPGAGPWDSVSGQPIASGNGTTTTFQLIRTTGGFVESIQAPYTDPPPTVYVDGIQKAYGTDYSVDDVGQIIFVSAPANGKAITADFSYYWPVRFGSDDLDVDTMMWMLWECKKIVLTQVRL